MQKTYTLELTLTPKIVNASLTSSSCEECILCRAPPTLKSSPAKDLIRKELMFIMDWSQPLSTTIIYSSVVMTRSLRYSTRRQFTFPCFSGQPYHMLNMPTRRRRVSWRSLVVESSSERARRELRGLESFQARNSA